MNPNDLFLDTVQDHIMANTWRLIIERAASRRRPHVQPIPDFRLLVEVLPEYRLIGLHLAAANAQRFST